MTAGRRKDKAGLPYRRGVGAMLINAAGRVFVGLRKGGREKNAWQMPQGAIDEGEKPADAVFRELEEETGTSDAVIVAETKGWLSYDLPPDLIGTAWGGRYRGQTQKWFALRFTGRDSDFDLDAHEKPEFVTWKWVELDELPGLIVPFKRRLYRDVIAEFRDIPRRIAADE